MEITCHLNVEHANHEKTRTIKHGINCICTYSKLLTVLSRISSEYSCYYIMYYIVMMMIHNLGTLIDQLAKKITRFESDSNHCAAQVTTDGLHNRWVQRIVEHLPAWILLINFPITEPYGVPPRVCSPRFHTPKGFLCCMAGALVWSGHLEINKFAMGSLLQFENKRSKLSFQHAELPGKLHKSHSNNMHCYYLINLKHTVITKKITHLHPLLR